MNWFQELKSEIMTFLEKATKKEIQLALERANYDFYKDFDVKILAFHEIIYAWVGTATFKASFKLSEQIMIKSEAIPLEEMIISADHYSYSLAA